MNAKKRGRPSKKSIFLDQSAPRFGKRPASNFARQMAAAVAGRVAGLKGHKEYGPYVNLDLIQDVEMADLLGLPLPQDTQQQLADAAKKRTQNGIDGGTTKRDPPAWQRTLNDQFDLVHSMMKKDHSAALIGQSVRRNWTALGGLGAPPSVRTLRRYVSQNKLAKNYGPKK